MSLQLNLQRKGLPFYVQVRDQIRDAICSGKLRPGDKLPTVRALSEEYGTSTNTVLHAYQDLEREGWVVNSPRIGCLVQDIAERRLDAPDLSIDAARRLWEALDAIYATGISGEDFLAVVNRLVADGWSRERADRKHVALITDDARGAAVDTRDVEEATGIPVRWVSLQDVRAHGIWTLGDVRQLRAVVVMFYRYGEVRKRLGALPIFPLTTTTEPEAIQNAVRYNRPDVRIAVIAHDPDFIEPLSFSVNRLLFDCPVVGYGSLKDIEAARELVRQADLVAGSFWANDERYFDLLQGKPSLALGTRADPSSLQVLRQALEADDLHLSLWRGQQAPQRPASTRQIEDPLCPDA